MLLNVAVFLSDLRAAGIDPAPAMRLGGKGDLEFLDPVPPQSVVNQVLAVLAAHDPNKPLPPTQHDLDLQALAARIDDVTSDGTLPAKVKAFVTALKKVL